MASFSCFIVGEGALALNCLEVLSSTGCQVLGIFSADDSLKTWATEHDIIHTSCQEIFQEQILNTEYEYLFSINNVEWIIPPYVIAQAQKATINYHDSLLPKYAGLNATSWALLNGESQHGVTWHEVVSETNAGRIFKQKVVPILADDTAFSLNIRCFDIAVESFRELVQDLASNYIEPYPQSLSQSSYFGASKRPAAACLLSFNGSSQDICNLVRALDFGPVRNPLGLPKLWLPGGVVVVKAAQSVTQSSQEGHRGVPGQISKLDATGLWVATADATVLLSHFTTLDGQDLSVETLSTNYGVQLGTVLPALESDLQERISQYHAAICNHEPAWVKQLLQLIPFKHPYLPTETPGTLSNHSLHRYPITLATQQITPKTLLSTFAAYCARLTTDLEFDLGLQTDAQRHPAAEIFAQQVPLHVTVDPTQAFRAFQTQIETSLENAAHRGSYALDIVSRYPELRDAALLNDLPVTLVLANSPEQLNWRSLKTSIALVAYQDGSTPELIHGGALSDWASAAIVQQLQTLIAACVEQPDTVLSQLPILTAAERHQVLVGWNNTTIDYPRDKCIHQLFEEQVEKTPDAIAIVFECQTLTYRELNHRANQLAHHLRSFGIGPESLVGICIERSFEMVIGLLGILKAGGSYVPLDPAYPEDRLDYMIENSELSLLLTQKLFRDQFAKHPVQVVGIDTDWDAIAQQRHDNPDSGIVPDNLAYTIYTSGSTGKPKGVQICHRPAVNFLNSMAIAPGLTANDRLLAVTTISFDIAVLELYLPLLVGAQIILSTREIATDAAQLSGLMVQAGATVMQATPATWRMLFAGGWQGHTGLKMLCGGEAMTRELADQLLARGGELWNMYGPTETTVWSAAYRVEAGEGSIPVAGPIANTQLYILETLNQPEGETVRPVPIGIAGEVFIGGDGLARGYLNRPDLTQERFIADPFSDQPGARLYRTGDLACSRPNGALEFLGRIDHQVKIRGFRIELGEIEAALIQHPALQQCVVIAREDEPGDKRLVAYAVVAAGETFPTVTELRQFLKQSLPDYMVPVAFVQLDTLPLTPNGKVDRRALPKPTPGSNVGADFIAPVTATERSLATLWCDILNLEQVGVESNFFDLGGTSILGVQLVARIQAQFDIALRAVKLYQYPTIQTLAQYVDQLMRPQEQAQFQPKVRRQAADDRSTDVDSIAIIGMVGRFPGANTVDELWQNLCAEQESITFFEQDDIDSSVAPELRDHPAYIRAKGIVEGAENFDAAFFGISPREAEVMDPQVRVFLEMAQEALENAGYSPEQYSGHIGVYAGSRYNNYFEQHVLPRPEIMNRLDVVQAMMAKDKDYFATRVSYKLNLTGPSVNVNTACSTSLVATAAAFKGLVNYECDIALAGAVSINTPQNTGHLYKEGSIYSPDGRCRPFDAQAQGTVFSNGAGIVVLKRLKEALADGDRIYAVIKGVGINNDGSDKVSFTAPSVNGQAGAILQAQMNAGVHPESISYIEAHGTGTPLGDPIEIEALTQAFRYQTKATQYCAIGSIKSNIGHTDTAAGMAGLIKAALALHHKQIPASLGFEAPNPQIDFANSPFYVNTQLVDWPAGETPRRAGVSSFGIGGTNAHLILEEAPAVQSSSPSRPYQLLPLSAKTPAALAQATENLKQQLQQNPEINLADVAYTLRVGRKAFNHRRYVVCRDVAEATEVLESLDTNRSGTRETRLRHPEVVFMFPGQGSQYVNMGLNLYQHEPIFRTAVDRCAELLQPLLQLDIRELLYPKTGEEETAAAALGQTSYTQPALFTVEYALAQLWISWGVRPAAMIGHSIGEFVAACVAEVFSLEDALKLVAARGRMMWELPRGSMLSVPMSAKAMEKYLDDELAIAAVNGPALCVVSGPTEKVAALQANLTTEGIVCKTLYTSHAFHSPMMDPIVEPFTELVRSVSLSLPKIPFVSTVTADWITPEQATDPLYWAGHLRATVRFAEGIQTLWQQPERILLEVGPRLTATTMARQQASDPAQQVAIASLGKTAEADAEWLALLQAVGQLWLAGAEIDITAFYANESRHRLPLTTYPFQRQRYWVEAQSPHKQTNSASTQVMNLLSQGNVDQLAQLLAQDGQTAVNRELLERLVKLHQQQLTDLSTDAIQEESEVEAENQTRWLQQLEAMMSADRMFFLRQTLQEEVGHLLGMSKTNLPDPQVGFFQLGMDSLMAVELRARLSQLLEVALPSTLTFDYPNIASLEKYLLDEHLGHIIKADIVEPEPEEEITFLEAELLAAIEQASDEELENSIDQILASF